MGAGPSNGRKGTGTEETSFQHLQKVLAAFNTGIDTYKKDDLDDLVLLIKDRTQTDFLKEEEKTALLELIRNIEKPMTLKKSGDKAFIVSLNEANEDQVGALKNELKESDDIKQLNIQDKIDGIFKPYTTLKTHAMFYRYKYVQTNVVLIMLISQFQDLFENLLSNVVGHMNDLINIQKGVINKYVELAEKLSEFQKKDGIESDDIGGLHEDVRKALEKKYNELDAESKKYNKDTIKDLINVLINTNQEVANVQEIKRGGGRRQRRYSST